MLASRSRALAIVGAGVLALGMLSAYLFAPVTSTQAVSFGKSDDFFAPRSFPIRLSSPQHANPVYPYSVIPGGLHDLKSLRELVQRDPVLAQHYSNLSLQNVRFVTASEKKSVFVSYRMNGRIFWTTQRVRIPKGETLITDGSEWIRTRCGNRISETPQVPTSPEEPPVSELEDPIPTFLPVPTDPVDPPSTVEQVIPPVIELPSNVPTDASDIPPFVVPLPLPPGSSFPPFLPPIPIVPPLGPSHPPVDPPPVIPPPHRPPPPMSVPEPQSLLLLATGLGVLIGACRKYNR